MCHVVVDVRHGAVRDRAKKSILVSGHEGESLVSTWAKVTETVNSEMASGIVFITYKL